MYYKFLDSIDAKEIGYHPQLADFWPGTVDYWAPTSFVNAPLEGVIDFEIVFPAFRLATGARLTDRLSTGCLTGDFIVVSERLLKILETVEIDQYQDFPVLIETSTGSVGYRILYFPFPRDDHFINWEKSVFLRAGADGTLKQEWFGSAREFNLARDGHQLRLNTMVIQEDVIARFDLFKLKWVKGGTYVSDRLRQRLVKEGVTGVRFEEADWMDNVQWV